MKTLSKQSIFSISISFQLFIIIQLLPYKIQAQDVNVKFSGFVKTDIMFDTRQVVSAREGQFLLYPAAQNIDAANKDINQDPNLNILSIQTRLTSKITGPDAFGAKTSGMVEGAFFGQTDGNINGFRLRHAFLKLDWECTSVLIGQYWHPMFVPEVFPGVISFNTGVPFQPFSRNPQVRITQSINNFVISLSALEQRDFTSMGPNGACSEYLRYSSIPMLDMQIMFKTNNFVLGFGADYKSLKPRLASDKNFKNENRINSLAVLGYTKIQHEKYSVKLEGTYGSNLTDLLMLGGYAVSSKDSITGIESYTNVKTLSLWSDLSYGKELSFGLFTGFTKNLGADDPINGAYYSRGNNIEKVFRIAPRVQVDSGITRFAAELEYTSAYYGTPDNKDKVMNSYSVSNTRFLIAAYYFF